MFQMKFKPVLLMSIRTMVSSFMVEPLENGLRSKSGAMPVLSFHLDYTSFPYSTPRSVEISPLRVLDIGCQTGESTDFLYHFIQEHYPNIHSSSIDMIGMDTCSQKLQKASKRFPHYQFLHYDLFQSSLRSLKPHRVHILQMSLDRIMDQFPYSLRCIDHVLHKEGVLHLYGNVSSIPFPSSSSPVECIYRQSWDHIPSMEYLVLRKESQQSFSHLLFPLLQSLSKY